jgi:hypothetical protein
MTDWTGLEETLQPHCDQILKDFEARHVGELTQVLVIATLAACLPEALGNIDDAPVSAQAFVDTALTVALEERGFVVTRRRADA